MLEQARERVARVGTARHRHSLDMAEQHWQAWAALNDRTKSSILKTFTSAVSGLLFDPLLYEKFSCGLTRGCRLDAPARDDPADGLARRDLRGLGVDRTNRDVPLLAVERAPPPPHPAKPRDLLLRR